MTDGLVGTPLDLVVVAVYFIGVVGFGLWFGRYTTTTTDFFFGGQRFAWWLIAFSGIATTVGSYSFVKYSNVGFKHGISSTMSYMNDWFWIPILIFLWLPVLYYSKIKSVPEYMERRFGFGARMAAIALIMLYLIGYVGINLYTLGTVVNSLVSDVPILAGAIATAFVVMLYMFAGGQTSVIMTDLAQGIILLIAGLGLFFYGVWYLGGFGDFWALMPRGHKFMFSEFAAPDNFSFIGIYGQDGLANTGAFILMNQGMIMRFLSLKSVNEARKMAIFWILVLYPIAAITVSGGGWIAMALVQHGELDPGIEGDEAFVQAASYLVKPGIFGFLLAAVTAALMSTADTLVTAVSAIFLNDVYRPYIRPNRPDRHYLNVARISSTTVVIIGVLLVPIFQREKSIYDAHGMFTAAVTPPIVMAIFLGLLSKRITPTAAIATMVAGTGAVFLSFHPSLDNLLLDPFSFGMGEGSYKYTRSLFGLSVCATIGIGVSLFTKARPLDDIRGLVNGTQMDAMRAFKGGMENRAPGSRAYAPVEADPALAGGEIAHVPAEAMQAMQANPGDLVYLCDPRWWFGGLRSVHLRLGEVSDNGAIRVPPEAIATAHFKPGQEIYVEKII